MVIHSSLTRQPLKLKIDTTMRKEYPLKSKNPSKAEGFGVSEKHTPVLSIFDITLQNPITRIGFLQK